MVHVSHQLTTACPFTDYSAPFPDHSHLDMVLICTCVHKINVIIFSLFHPLKWLDHVFCPLLKYGRMFHMTDARSMSLGWASPEGYSTLMTRGWPPGAPHLQCMMSSSCSPPPPTPAASFPCTLTPQVTSVLYILNLCDLNMSPVVKSMLLLPWKLLNSL